MHLHAGWENVGIVAALPANHDILFPKALRSPTRNPIARGTTESFHDVDGTPRRQCRPTERLRQIGRFSQTSAHLGVDLAARWLMARARKGELTDPKGAAAHDKTECVPSRHALASSPGPGWPRLAVGVRQQRTLHTPHKSTNLQSSQNRAKC